MIFLDLFKDATCYVNEISESLSLDFTGSKSARAHAWFQERLAEYPSEDSVCIPGNTSL